MKKLLLAVTIAASFVAPAFAGSSTFSYGNNNDNYTQKVSWSGCHASIDIGHTNTSNEVSVEYVNIDALGSNGATLGATLGCDRQVGQNVFGAFVQGSHSFDNTFSVGLGPDSFNVEQENTFKVGLRAGHLISDSTLLYITGGYAWADLSTNVPELNLDDRHGYFFGGGVETFLTSNGRYTLAADYTGTWYNDDNVYGDYVTVKGTDHTFTTRLKYNFGR